MTIVVILLVLALIVMLSFADDDHGIDRDVVMVVRSPRRQSGCFLFGMFLLGVLTTLAALIWLAGG